MPKAHLHAHRAASETQNANIAGARNEHAAAATDFASAANDTDDIEALRILRLLEEHHRRLSDLVRDEADQTLKGKAEKEHSGGTADTQSQKNDSKLASSEGTNSPAKKPERVQRETGTTPLSPKAQRGSLSSSSIASNLASARGIPPLKTRVGPVEGLGSISEGIKQRTKGQARQKSPESVRKLSQITEEGSAKISIASGIPNPDVASQESRTDEKQSKQDIGFVKKFNDEPFQRFYSTFEGLISKLSAPLAFAGLPLSEEENPPSKSQKIRSTSASVSSEPDVNRLFSRSALRAIREEAASSKIFGPAESFYVVPITGGTGTYADVARSQAHQRGSSTLEGSQEFVDASEFVSSASPAHTRRPSLGTRGKKTMEELELENQALREMSNALSKRIHAWESTAGDRSMALHQSFMAQRSTTASPTRTEPTAQAVNEERARVLEGQMNAAQRELSRMKRENEKLNAVVGRYRERWEKLKEGARMRREGGDRASESPS